MKVFMSWSGERSHALANALHEWLPLVLHYIQTWLSQADIDAGQRWADQVAKELEATNFGILCITRENLASPWILFEAGALAKSIQGSRVIPFLLELDFSEISGPLAQFQAKKVDRTGVFEVVQSINQIAEPPVQEDRVRQLFDALWPDLEKKIQAIPKLASATKHTRPQPEILEELVSSVRTLDGRLRDIGEDGPRLGRSKYRRFHPMMIHELRDIIGVKRGDPVLLLIVASIFRDEMPWIYELGMEAYRVAKSGSATEARAARRQFQRAAESMRHAPFGSEFLDPDSRMMLQMTAKELDHFLGLDLEPATEDTRTTPLKKKSGRQAQVEYKDSSSGG